MVLLYKEAIKRIKINMIPIYKPYIPKNSLNHAESALYSGWISSLGDYKKLAENKLANILKVNHLLLTCNGTAASHLLIKALKFKHPEIKKIIVPNNVYITAWNILLYDRYDYEIIPIDANLDTWNADYSKIDLDINTKDTAFLIVHNMGNIVNVPALKKKYRNAVFIEDNCEGIFGEYEGSSSGTQSLCSSLSFFGNKNITTGEGGAILINDSDEILFSYINKLHGQGQTNIKFIHDELGYNYRMTNIHAAILLGQLEIYDKIKSLKANIFQKYKEFLYDTPGIFWQQTEPGCCHSHWMFGVRIAKNSSYVNAKLFFDNKGIETRPLFYPITYHKHLSKIKSITKVAEQLNNECVILPSYPELTDIEIEYIVDCVKKYNNSLN